MTNREIAGKFRELADLMELLGDNPFKIRSYRSAYQKLRSYDHDLENLSLNELESIPGVGKAISAKIIELGETGEISALEKVKNKVPGQVAELLKIKGLGPGKVRKLWKGLEILSPGELLYACEENRLISLKGFGEKSQEDIRNKVKYYLSQRGYFFFHQLDDAAKRLIESIKEHFPNNKTEVSGDLRRLENTASEILLLTTISADELKSSRINDFILTKIEGGSIEGMMEEKWPVRIHTVAESDFGLKQLQLTGPENFVNSMLGDEKNKSIKASDEDAVFDSFEKAYLQPEFRNWADTEKAYQIQDKKRISEDDIKGVVHSHSTWSDGAHSLEKMALAARDKGFEYLAITDHSAYASYAGGLKEKDVLAQWEEIDQLNQQLAPFRIIKGIEADILPDGSMDYTADLLGKFELVIASVHSVLNMDIEKATKRLISAVENPHVHMLGHPTGRLLLSRPGYPLDKEKLLDACAANGVIIELNANPYRLDLDWSWIIPAMERGIKFSINPDAHSIEGIDDIRHGVRAARKGGMLMEDCINCLSEKDFLGIMNR